MDNLYTMALAGRGRGHEDDPPVVSCKTVPAGDDLLDVDVERLQRRYRS
jgi:hypothetical protein